MWYGAQVADILGTYAKDYGFDFSKKTFDFKQLKANRQAYIDRIHASYERGFDQNGVDRIYDYAVFKDAHTVEIAGQTYTAPHILIATGGHPVFPDIEGAEFGISSDGFLPWMNYLNVRLWLEQAILLWSLLVFYRLWGQRRIYLFVTIDL